jgi:membrane-associated protease RseP (regulator of RpoE activity)
VIGNLLGWLVVLGIGVPLSIALHEIGHLVPAKKFGIKCSQYFVGFGPTVWSRRVGETEYGVKAIPLGGYVRMLGMFPPKPGRPARADSTGRIGLMIEAARQDAQREISEQDRDRLFYQRSVPKRLVVMLGGPVMNLVIAVVLLSGLVTLYGVATATTTVGAVSRCVLPVATSASDTARACTPTDRPAPAARAGFLPGDVIVSFDGAPVSTWAQVRDAIRANRGTPVPVILERDGKRIETTVTPMVDTRYVLDEGGNVVKGADEKYLTTQVGFLGVTPRSEPQRQPISAVPGIVGDAVAGTAGVLLRVPEKMVGVVEAVFGGGQRDPNGPISVVGVGRLAGEVGAIQGTDAAPITWGDKVAFWLSIIASLNLALFVFNLVPLLPLDGGHVAGALWEGLRRQVARVLRRPDPGPVDIARALPLAYGVGSVLIVLSAMLIVADITDPIRLGG